MDFWTHAFDSLGDNLSIIGAVGSDLLANVNPFSDEFLTGDATATATEVERQIARDQGRQVNPQRIDASKGGGLGTVRDATAKTVDDTKAAAGQALDTAGKAAGGVLDAITSPWVLGALALVVAGVLAAPYVVPAYRAVTA